MDKDKQKQIDDLLAYYKDQVDFLANQKARVLEDLVRQARAVKAGKLAQRIKGKDNLNG